LRIPQIFSKFIILSPFLINNLFFYSELIQRPGYAEILKIGTTKLQMKTTPISFQLTSLQSCLGDPRTRCLMDVRSRISINVAFDIKKIRFSNCILGHLCVIIMIKNSQTRNVVLDFSGLLSA
jgi:hypothetical protein